jgi:hypothetical protein
MFYSVYNCPVLYARPNRLPLLPCVRGESFHKSPLAHCAYWSRNSHRILPRLHASTSQTATSSQSNALCFLTELQSDLVDMPLHLACAIGIVASFAPAHLTLRANLLLLILAPATVLSSLSLRSLVSGTADQTESAADVPVARSAAVGAVGNSRVVGAEVPAAALEAARGGIFDILAPLAHISAHVINP